MTLSDSRFEIRRQWIATGATGWSRWPFILDTHLDIEMRNHTRSEGISCSALHELLHERWGVLLVESDCYELVMLLFNIAQRLFSNRNSPDIPAAWQRVVKNQARHAEGGGRGRGQCFRSQWERFWNDFGPCASGININSKLPSPPRFDFSAGDPFSYCFSRGVKLEQIPIVTRNPSIRGIIDDAVKPAK